MPWKSSGLSVRGRLKAAISTLSRGKFSPSDPCEFVERDFASHAKNLNISAWNNVWSKLADVWDILTTKGPITSVHKGWGYASYIMSSAIDSAQLMHILHADGYVAPEATPMPILLYFPTIDEAADIDNLEVDEGVVICNRISPCSYEIPEDIRDIYVLRNFINFPTLNLTKLNQDYLVTSELLPGKVGRITFGSEVVVGRQMWMTKYSTKKSQEMVDRFGAMVGYDTVRGDEYDTFADIYFLRMIQMYGPTNPSLELGITIMQGWPYTRFNCKVESIESDHSSMSVSQYPPTASTEGVTYDISNITGLPFQVYHEGEWYDITEGAFLPLGRPITKAVRCFDLKRDPDLSNNFIFSPLEKHHKTVVAFNDDIEIIEEEWEFINYVGAISGFAIGDKLTGTDSGAWGYITQSLLDPPDPLSLDTVGRVELRRVKGVFEAGEVIFDEHGATAVLDSIGGYSYAVDQRVTVEFLERNKRFGADFKTLVWIDHLAPEGSIETTYLQRLFSPDLTIETDVFSRLEALNVTLDTDAWAGMNSPDPGALTTWLLGLNGLDAAQVSTFEDVLQCGEASISGDLFIEMGEPITHGVTSYNGGLLDYIGGAWPNNDRVVEGQTSGAIALITSDDHDVVSGTVTLRMVRGMFEDGEIIEDEDGNTRTVSGYLY